MLVTVGRVHSQTAAEAIRKNAIECKDWTAPNQKIYTLLKDYKFICVGEMHGTKEPAEFLIGLVRTFVSNNRKVVVGLEIHDSLMTSFHQQQDLIGLLKTSFFTQISGYGIESEAWFSAIDACNKQGVRYCFFDNSREKRDYGMYEKLLRSYQADTNVVVITLGGNFHNKLSHDNETMGGYLKDRFGNKVCSINHIYNGGTMYNQTSEGLGLHQLQSTDDVFSTSTLYDAYFIPNIFTSTDYSGFFYTKTVTASLPKTK